MRDVIEHSKLINQVPETKGREKYNNCNYYYNELKAVDNSYNFKFEVVSMSNGENQYRVQRLEKKMKKTGNYDGDISNKTNILPPYSQPAFSANNISQSNNNANICKLNTI